MDRHPLDKLFTAKHVVILGFSKDRTKLGYEFLSAMLTDGYEGEISLLGRESGEFEGLRIYGSPEELPDGIDVALNLLSPQQTVTTLPRVAARGIPFAVVFTSGFAEQSAEQADAQAKLVEDCRSHGMRIVGPNCMGTFNMHTGLNLTSVAGIPAGYVGMVSQSGNIAFSLWDQAPSLDIGFSKFVGVGNQADIPMHEYIDYLGTDDETKVIILYIEGLKAGHGPKFLETCARVSRIKPIIALKGGRGEAGSRAAQSHTASLSSPDRVFSALLREAGVIQVDHLEQALPTAQALVLSPPMRGDNVAIVGSGGGHSTAMTDEVEATGLNVPEYSQASQQELLTHLPAWAPVRNPVDMTGAFTSKPSLFAELSRLVIERDEHFSASINYGLFGRPSETEDAERDERDLAAARLLGELQRETGLPIVFYSPYANRTSPPLSELRASGIPCFSTVETAALALKALRQRALYLESVSEPAVEPAAASDAGSTADLTTESGAYELLSGYGVEFPPSAVAASPAELAAVAEKIGFPVVVKGVAPGVAHKSELGLVRLGIADAASAVAAAEQMADAGVRLDGYLVARDYGRARELLVGVTRDTVLGTVALLGFGGVFAEAVDDVAVCLLPATPRRVRAALEALSSSAMWADFRHYDAVDIDSLVETVNGMNRAMTARPEIESIECNPVLVVDGKLIAVDAAIETSKLEEERKDAA